MNTDPTGGEQPVEQPRLLRVATAIAQNFRETFRRLSLVDMTMDEAPLRASQIPFKYFKTGTPNFVPRDDNTIFISVVRDTITKEV